MGHARQTIGTLGAVATLALVAACGAGGGADASGPPPTKAEGAATVTTRQMSGTTYLADHGGHALYLWLGDSGSTSACLGGCADEWPPLLTVGAPKAAGDATAAALGTTRRADGATQVTYAGHPLYYYAEDSGVSVNGQGNDNYGALWWVVAPSGRSLTSDFGGSTGGGGYGY